MTKRAFPNHLGKVFFKPVPSLRVVVLERSFESNCNSVGLEVLEWTRFRGQALKDMKTGNENDANREIEKFG